MFTNFVCSTQLYVWMMVQVIAESLPISSSGHVILLQRLLYSNTSTATFSDLWAFDYFIQGISALLFLIYFFSQWWQLIFGPHFKISDLWDGAVWKKNIIPVLMFGIIVDGVTSLMWLSKIADYIQLPLFCGFAITAGALWSMRYTKPNKNVQIWSVKNGLILGLVQGCALIPGVSRFGSTLAVLQWLGYPRKKAFEISFLVQWPLIVAGSIIGLYSLHKSSLIGLGSTVYFTLYEGPCIRSIDTELFIECAGFATMIALLLLSCVEQLIDKNQLWKFCYYMMIPIIIALFV